LTQAKNLPYLAHPCTKIKSIFYPKEKKVKVPGISVKTKDPEKIQTKIHIFRSMLQGNTPVADTPVENTLKRRK
jgi:hypothetical protein